MASRSLGSATVLAFVAWLAAEAAQAQNLDAGKSPGQIFSQTCAVCHKSVRGLLKTTSPGSLPSFLRQHYTTSSDMAAMLSAYVISNGAASARHGGDNLTRQGREARTGAGAEPGQPQAEPRASRRRQPPADGVAEGAQPGQSAALPPEGPAARQKSGRKGRGRDAAKPEPSAPATLPADAVKPIPADETPAPLRPEPTPEGATPPPATQEAARPESPAAAPADQQETPLRADPVPAVTPAPKTSEGEGEAAASSEAPPRPTIVVEPPPPALAITVPQTPPAGPPISQ